MKTIPTLLLLIISFIVHGQSKRDYIWLLGKSYSINSDNDRGFYVDFGEPDARFKKKYTGIKFGSQNASISDEDGNLLFCSNGTKVFNRDLELMENGDSLNYDQWIDIFWAGDLSQGYPGVEDIMILPRPDSSEQYYILHKPFIFNSYNEKDSIPLWYSLVDLRYNHGLGKVIEKNSVAFHTKNLLSSYMTGIAHRNQRDYWIIAPQANSTIFKTFRITAAGIEEQEDQASGYYMNRKKISAGGLSKFSPDGTKYAMFSYESQLHLYDFDRETGKLSNHQAIQVDSEIKDQIIFSGIEWSPNSRFIYTSSAYELYQVDTKDGEVEQDDIRLIDTYNGTIDPFHTIFFLMALAPDCKIYMCPTSSTMSYHVIHQPDRLGTDCDFDQNGVRLPVITGVASFPNFPRFRVDAEEKCDSTITTVFGKEVFYRKELNVYPVPARSSVTIALPDHHNGGKIMLWNEQGGLVQERSVSFEDTFSVDISSLSTGRYLIEYFPKQDHSRIYYSSWIIKK